MRNITPSVVIGLFFFAVASYPAPAQETVNIMVDVLEASEGTRSIDPGLSYIREQIDRSPFRYQRYRNLAGATRTIPLGKKEVISFVLPEQLSLEITPKRLDKRTVLLGIRVWEGRQVILDSDLSLARKGTVLIGAPTSAKRAVMFAISEGL